MSKIICDICGTSYPDTAEQCPICGYAKELNGDNILGLAQEPAENVETAEEETVEAKGGLFGGVKARKQNHSDDNLDDDDDDDDEYDDDDDDDEEPRSNTFLIVILVILIVALACVIGFIHFKYFKPNVPNNDKANATTVATQAAETTLPTETTQPRIPCTGLTMTSDGNVILEQEGHSWLINVVAQPEDTTDQIVYTSSDESVVTVNSTGTLTAVGQGEAVVTITCGDQTLNCNVTCFFIEETEEPTVTTAPAEFEDETLETTEPAEETEPATEAPEETTAPETEATEPEDDKDDGEVTLTLKRTDLSFGMLGAVYTLEIEEDIDPADVKWSSANGNIVIVHNGMLRTTGKGVTKIYAEYKGAKAECVIRVSY